MNPWVRGINVWFWLGDYLLILLWKICWFYGRFRSWVRVWGHEDVEKGSDRIWQFATYLWKITCCRCCVEIYLVFTIHYGFFILFEECGCIFCWWFVWHELRGVVQGLMIFFCVGKIVFSEVGRREGNLWGRDGSWGIVWGWDFVGRLALYVLSLYEYWCYVYVICNW